MALENAHVFIRVCLVLSLTTTAVYCQTRNDPPRHGTHTQSRSYFDELSQASRAARQKEYFERADVQEKLAKISDTLMSYSDTFNRKLPVKLPAEFLGVTYKTLLKRTMLSALENVSANETSPSACVNDTGHFITSLFNASAWAIQFVDSAGKPGPGLTQGSFKFIGNYHQCRAVSTLSADGRRTFHGNYCTLKANIGAYNPLGLLSIEIGVCVPDSCSDTQTTLFVTEVIQLLNLNGSLHAESTVCHTEEREMTTATVVAIAVLAIIGVLMVIGTIFDIFFVQLPKWKRSHEKNNVLNNSFISQANGYKIIGDEDQVCNDEATSLLGNNTVMKKGGTTEGVCSKILVAFSVYTNGSKVLNTSQPEGSLGAIHGIRFLSMSWVVLGHVFVFGIGQFENLLQFSVLLQRWTFDGISNAFASVDTFFTMSGLLTSYLALTEMKKRGWKLNWALFYFHRFWRLTPPYMLTLLMVLGLQQYMGAGALWSPVQPADKEYCEQNWWTNLLYVNNLVKSDKMCFGHSWYLSNDMQFFILSPLMFVPFYFNFFYGLAACTGFLLITWITTGVLSTQNLWPPSVIVSQPDGGMATYMKDYYIKPWCRIGPYVIGLMAGAWLSHRRGRTMSVYAAIIGWIIATATGLAVVYGLHDDISGKAHSSIGVSAFYNAVARSAWGACVCWVIVACASGYGGFVNSLLSWPAFVVLGRLTYMAYLIHPYIMTVYFQNMERLLFLTDTTIVIIYCGLVVITNMVAFVLMLAFESPWIGLERTFLRKKQKE